ncbi:DUF397 domain-containing protein [Streptomyces sp. ET3-23]|uniref:DUF397 domain-containing protein n=1 Tax=Streptomyces sp. ET3-23 TaxID=2885643 RepID=UPI001D130017|nr:DUF397 domain-containing protein [Streptomyces sp. ET3-23]MCC2278680.1 DUF397 domain-containing protein [Streptomyces sp. ET3-23]
MHTGHDLNAATWRKSSHSGPGNGTGGDDCLEVADNIPGVVPVRDSKNPHGPALAFPAAAWAAFVAGHASAAGYRRAAL